MSLHKTHQHFIRWARDAPTCWCCRTSNISHDFAPTFHSVGTWCANLLVLSDFKHLTWFCAILKGLFKSIRRLSPSQTPSRRRWDRCQWNLCFVQSQRHLFATLCLPQPSTQRTFASTRTSWTVVGVGLGFIIEVWKCMHHAPTLELTDF